MVGFFGLSEIHFAVRRADGQSDIVISPGSVTILVGPNNSGKSTALREIHQLYMGLPFDALQARVVRNIKMVEPESWATLLSTIAPWKIAPSRPPHRWDGGLVPRDPEARYLEFGTRGGVSVSILENDVLAQEGFPSGLDMNSYRHMVM